jgi:hypothetical protein
MSSPCVYRINSGLTLRIKCECGSVNIMKCTCGKHDLMCIDCNSTWHDCGSPNGIRKSYLGCSDCSVVVKSIKEDTSNVGKIIEKLSPSAERKRLIISNL